MLVLTRKVGEEIRVGDEIRVKVLSVAGGRVKLGFDAPRRYDIVRAEMLPGRDAVAQPETETACCHDSVDLSA